MKLGFIIVSTLAVTLTACVSRPSTIEGVNREQERYIDDMQSHRYDPEVQNNSGVDLEKE